MKKSLKTKFGFLFAIFFLLSSCRTELLDNENQTNLTKQSYIIKQLNYEQLKQQAPIVVEKIFAFKTISNPQNINSKIYNDKEEGFIVNTESAIYIENEKGEKTYTFKIEKRESDAEILENLVLKEIGNSEYEAFISTYDKFVLENLSKLSLEELKRHVSMVPIGKRTSSDIFGKYNADPCQVMMPMGIYDYYVPGSLCLGPGAGGHDYAHIGICEGNIPGSGITLPTPDFNFSAITYGSFDTCGGGGASGGVGSSPVSTSPSNGGSGGSTSTSMVNDCNTVKKPFNEIPTLKAEAQNLAPKVTDDKEHGFAVMKNYNPANPITPIPTGTNGKMDYPLNPANIYIVHAHTHNSPKEETYSVPSWGDLDWISLVYQLYHKVDSNTVFIIITADGTRYALTISNWDNFTRVLYMPKDASAAEIEKGGVASNIAKIYYGENPWPGSTVNTGLIKEGNTDKEQDLIYFLQMIQENDMGINVFEVDSQFNTFTRVTLNAMKKVKRTPCN